MNLRANATFRAGDFSRVEALLVPKMIAGAGAGAQVVYQASQEIVHVDTGELKDSGVQPCPVEWVGKRVTGYVVYTARHAAYNEFGTGIRGAASPGAGPYSYNSNWPGMAAIPFLRPPLDTERPQILAAFREALGL